MAETASWRPAGGSPRQALDPEGSPNGGDDRVGNAVHLVFRLGFDHHAGQGFSSGVADHHTAIAVEFLLGRMNGLLH